jgi:hypothetical protein
MASSHAHQAVRAVRVILHHLRDKFQRTRLLGPRQVLLHLLIVVHSGAQRLGMGPARTRVRLRLDGYLRWEDGRAPTLRAVYQAMHKLVPTELESVIRVGLAEVNGLHRHDLLLNGYRVVAIDGMRLNARRTVALARRCGLPRKADGSPVHQPQALLVVARCVRTGVVLAQEVARHDGSERACARRLLERLAEHGRLLVLLDRGFPARDLIALMQARRIAFIVRMCGGKRTWRELAPHARGAAHDTAVDLRLRQESGRWGTVALRAILSDKARRGRPRCDRTPRRLLLLTNLRGPAWKTQRIIDLYLRRWDIEVSFREDKRLLGIVRTRATTWNTFLNELAAVQIYRILMAILLACIAPHLDTGPWYERRRRPSTTLLMELAEEVLIQCLVSPRRAADLIDEHAVDVANQAEKYRRGRISPRRCLSVEGVWKLKQHRKAG